VGADPPGLETYLLAPRDPADIDLLVEALRPAPSPHDIDVVIGVRGPIAPPQMCSCLMGSDRRVRDLFLRPRRLIKGYPETREDQCRAFRSGGRGIVPPDHADDRQRRPYRRLSGLNYLAMRYPAIYAKAGGRIREGFFH